MSVSAKACAFYDCATELRIAKQQREYLAYTDKVLRGTWREVSRDETGMITGMLIPDRGGQKDHIELRFFLEIACGFPNFPENGEQGRFYLRADISQGDYQDDEVEYNFLHFVPDRKKR